MPFAIAPGRQLTEYLRSCGLEQDAKQLFLLPNLRAAAEKAVELLACWPAPEAAGSTACMEAVTAAIGNVQKSLKENQSTQSDVVGAFLAGLSQAADAAVYLQAWGYKGGRPIEQYHHEAWNFPAWAHGGGFDEIRFYARKEVRRSDKRGNRLKFVCLIAASRDIGYFQTYVGMHGFEGA